MDRGAWWATLHGVAQSQTRFSDLILCRRLLCDSHCGWRWPWDQTTQAACRDGGGLRGKKDWTVLGSGLEPEPGGGNRTEPVIPGTFLTAAAISDSCGPERGGFCWISTY